MSMKNWIPDDLYERITGVKRNPEKKVAKKSKQQKEHERQLKKQYKQMKKEEAELKELEEQNKLIIEKMLENSKIEDRMEEIKSKIQYLKTFKAPVIDNKTSQKEVTALIEDKNSNSVVETVDDEDYAEEGAVDVVKENKLDEMYYIKENVSKKKRKKLLRILSKYLDKNKKYKFIDMNDGLYKMYFLSKEGSLIENIIDPFATINGGSHPRIFKKSIMPNGDTAFGMFDLTLDIDLSRLLINSEDPYIDYNTAMGIPDNDPYNATVDFSNTPQLDKLDKAVLLNNVNFAVNAMANSGINIPKFRFFDLTDENHFCLISDFKVKTPLQYETLKENGVDNPIAFNRYIDNGRVLSFNDRTVYTYYVSDVDNKMLLAQPQPQQPQQQIDQGQLFNNIMDNGLGGGFNPFNPYPQQPTITPNIIMA